VDCDDLTELGDADERAMLEVLRNRFQKRAVYTKLGSSLVAVNPCQPVPTLYRRELLDTCLHSESFGAPHIFSLARTAFDSLEFGHRQFIIATGESGSGKTVTANHALRMLVESGASRQSEQLERRVLESVLVLQALGNAQSPVNANSSRFGRLLSLRFRNDRLMAGAVNHYMLERGRVTAPPVGELNFHVFYQLVDAARTGGALELSSRSTLQLKTANAGAEEKGASQRGMFRKVSVARVTDRDRYHDLGDDSHPDHYEEFDDHASTARQDNNQMGHHLLSSGGSGNASLHHASSTPKPDQRTCGSAAFAALLDGLERCAGMEESEQEEVSAVLAAILHLGDIEFTSTNQASAAETLRQAQRAKALRAKSTVVEGLHKSLQDKLNSASSTLFAVSATNHPGEEHQVHVDDVDEDDDEDDEKPADVSLPASLESLSRAAKLLHVGADQLRLALVCHYGGLGAAHVVPHTHRACEKLRDALIKRLYSALFDEVVLRLNEKMDTPDEADDEADDFDDSTKDLKALAAGSSRDIGSDTYKGGTGSGWIHIVDMQGYESWGGSDSHSSTETRRHAHGFDTLCGNYCAERVRAMLAEFALAVEPAQADMDGMQADAALKMEHGFSYSFGYGSGAQGGEVGGLGSSAAFVASLDGKLPDGRPAHALPNMDRDRDSLFELTATEAALGQHATSKGFLRRLTGLHPALEYGAPSDMCFKVSHFAGPPVVYSAVDILEATQVDYFHSAPHPAAEARTGAEGRRKSTHVNGVWRGLLYGQGGVLDVLTGSSQSSFVRKLASVGGTRCTASNAWPTSFGPAPMGGGKAPASFDDTADSTVAGMRFRNQLGVLCGAMRRAAAEHDTAPLFIACLRPNGNSNPLRFNSAMILRQLRTLRLHEVCRVRTVATGRAGSVTQLGGLGRFSYRMDHQTFIKRFWCCRQRLLLSHEHVEETPVALLECLVSNGLLHSQDKASNKAADFFMGQTHVFLRTRAWLVLLHARRQRESACAGKLQARARSLVTRARKIVTDRIYQRAGMGPAPSSFSGCRIVAGTLLGSVRRSLRKGDLGAAALAGLVQATGEQLPWGMVSLCSYAMVRRKTNLPEGDGESMALKGAPLDPPAYTAEWIENVMAMSQRAKEAFAALEMAVADAVDVTAETDLLALAEAAKLENLQRTDPGAFQTASETASPAAAAFMANAAALNAALATARRHGLNGTSARGAGGAPTAVEAEAMRRRVRDGELSLPEFKRMMEEGTGEEQADQDADESPDEHRWSVALFGEDPLAKAATQMLEMRILTTRARAGASIVLAVAPSGVSRLHVPAAAASLRALQHLEQLREDKASDNAALAASRATASPPTKTRKPGEAHIPTKTPPGLARLLLVRKEGGSTASTRAALDALALAARMEDEFELGTDDDSGTPGGRGVGRKKNVFRGGAQGAMELQDPLLEKEIMRVFSGHEEEQLRGNGSAEELARARIRQRARARAPGNGASSRGEGSTEQQALVNEWRAVLRQRSSAQQRLRRAGVASPAPVADVEAVAAALESWAAATANLHASSAAAPTPAAAAISCAWLDFSDAQVQSWRSALRRRATDSRKLRECALTESGVTLHHLLGDPAAAAAHARALTEQATNAADLAAVRGSVAVEAGGCMARLARAQAWIAEPELSDWTGRLEKRVGMARVLGAALLEAPASVSQEAVNSAMTGGDGGARPEGLEARRRWGWLEGQEAMLMELRRRHHCTVAIQAAAVLPESLHDEWGHRGGESKQVEVAVSIATVRTAARLLELPSAGGTARSPLQQREAGSMRRSAVIGRGEQLRTAVTVSSLMDWASHVVPVTCLWLEEAEEWAEIVAARFADLLVLEAGAAGEAAAAAAASLAAEVGAAPAPTKATAEAVYIAEARLSSAQGWMDPGEFKLFERVVSMRAKALRAVYEPIHTAARARDWSLALAEKQEQARMQALKQGLGHAAAKQAAAAEAQRVRQSGHAPPRIGAGAVSRAVEQLLSHAAELAATDAAANAKQAAAIQRKASTGSPLAAAQRRPEEAAAAEPSALLLLDDDAARDQLAWMAAEERGDLVHQAKEFRQDVRLVAVATEPNPTGTTVAAGAAAVHRMKISDLEAGGQALARVKLWAAYDESEAAAAPEAPQTPPPKPQSPGGGTSPSGATSPSARRNSRYSPRLSGMGSASEDEHSRYHNLQQLEKVLGFRLESSRALQAAAREVVSSALPRAAAPAAAEGGSGSSHSNHIRDGMVRDASARMKVHRQAHVSEDQRIQGMGRSAGVTLAHDGETGARGERVQWAEVDHDDLHANGAPVSLSPCSVSRQEREAVAAAARLISADDVEAGVAAAEACESFGLVEAKVWGAAARARLRTARLVLSGAALEGATADGIEAAATVLAGVGGGASMWLLEATDLGVVLSSRATAVRAMREALGTGVGGAQLRVAMDTAADIAKAGWLQEAAEWYITLDDRMEQLQTVLVAGAEMGSVTVGLHEAGNPIPIDVVQDAGWLLDGAEGEAVTKEKEMAWFTPGAAEERRAVATVRSRSKAVALMRGALGLGRDRSQGEGGGGEVAVVQLGDGSVTAASVEAAAAVWESTEHRDEQRWLAEPEGTAWPTKLRARAANVVVMRQAMQLQLRHKMGNDGPDHLQTEDEAYLQTEVEAALRAAAQWGMAEASAWGKRLRGRAGQRELMLRAAFGTHSGSDSAGRATPTPGPTLAEVEAAVALVTATPRHHTLQADAERRQKEAAAHGLAIDEGVDVSGFEHSNEEGWCDWMWTEGGEGQRCREALLLRKNRLDHVGSASGVTSHAKSKLSAESLHAAESELATALAEWMAEPPGSTAHEWHRRLHARCVSARTLEEAATAESGVALSTLDHAVGFLFGSTAAAAAAAAGHHSAVAAANLGTGDGHPWPPEQPLLELAAPILSSYKRRRARTRAQGAAHAAHQRAAEAAAEAEALGSVGIATDWLVEAASWGHDLRERVETSIELLRCAGCMAEGQVAVQKVSAHEMEVSAAALLGADVCLDTSQAKSTQPPGCAWLAEEALTDAIRARWGQLVDVHGAVQTHTKGGGAAEQPVAVATVMAAAKALRPGGSLFWLLEATHWELELHSRAQVASLFQRATADAGTELPPALEEQLRGSSGAAEAADGHGMGLMNPNTGRSQAHMELAHFDVVVPYEQLLTGREAPLGIEVTTRIFPERVTVKQSPESAAAAASASALGAATDPVRGGGAAPAIPTLRHGSKVEAALAQHLSEPHEWIKVVGMDDTHEEGTTADGGAAHSSWCRAQRAGVRVGDMIWAINHTPCDASNFRQLVVKHDTLDPGKGGDGLVLFSVLRCTDEGPDGMVLDHVDIAIPVDMEVHKPLGVELATCIFPDVAGAVQEQREAEEAALAGRDGGSEAVEAALLLRLSKPREWVSVSGLHDEATGVSHGDQSDAEGDAERGWCRAHRAGICVGDMIWAVNHEPATASNFAELIDRHDWHGIGRHGMGSGGDGMLLFSVLRLVPQATASATEGGGEKPVADGRPTPVILQEALMETGAGRVEGWFEEGAEWVRTVKARQSALVRLRAAASHDAEHGVPCIQIQRAYADLRTGGLDWLGGKDAEEWKTTVKARARDVVAVMDALRPPPRSDIDAAAVPVTAAEVHQGAQAFQRVYAFLAEREALRPEISRRLAVVQTFEAALMAEGVQADAIDRTSGHTHVLGGSHWLKEAAAWEQAVAQRRRQLATVRAAVAEEGVHVAAVDVALVTLGMATYDPENPTVGGDVPPSVGGLMAIDGAGDGGLVRPASGAQPMEWLHGPARAQYEAALRHRAKAIGIVRAAVAGHGVTPAALRAGARVLGQHPWVAEREAAQWGAVIHARATAVDTLLVAAAEVCPSLHAAATHAENAAYQDEVTAAGVRARGGRRLTIGAGFLNWQQASPHKAGAHKRFADIGKQQTAGRAVDATTLTADRTGDSSDPQEQGNDASSPQRRASSGFLALGVNSGAAAAHGKGSPHQAGAEAHAQRLPFVQPEAVEAAMSLLEPHRRGDLTAAVAGDAGGGAQAAEQGDGLGALPSGATRKAAMPTAQDSSHAGSVRGSLAALDARPVKLATGSADGRAAQLRASAAGAGRAGGASVGDVASASRRSVQPRARALSMAMQRSGRAGLKPRNAQSAANAANAGAGCGGACGSARGTGALASPAAAPAFAGQRGRPDGRDSSMVGGEAFGSVDFVVPEASTYGDLEWLCASKRDDAVRCVRRRQEQLSAVRKALRTGPESVSEHKLRAAKAAADAELAEPWLPPWALAGWGEEKPAELARKALAKKQAAEKNAAAAAAAAEAAAVAEANSHPPESLAAAATPAPSTPRSANAAAAAAAAQTAATAAAAGGAAEADVTAEEELPLLRPWRMELAGRLAIFRALRRLALAGGVPAAQAEAPDLRPKQGRRGSAKNLQRSEWDEACDEPEAPLTEEALSQCARACATYAAAATAAAFADRARAAAPGTTFAQLASSEVAAMAAAFGAGAPAREQKVNGLVPVRRRTPAAEAAFQAEEAERGRREAQAQKTTIDRMNAAAAAAAKGTLEWTDPWHVPTPFWFRMSIIWVPVARARVQRLRAIRRAAVESSIAADDVRRALHLCLVASHGEVFSQKKAAAGAANAPLPRSARDSGRRAAEQDNDPPQKWLAAELYGERAEGGRPASPVNVSGVNGSQINASALGYSQWLARAKSRAAGAQIAASACARSGACIAAVHQARELLARERARTAPQKPRKMTRLGAGAGAGAGRALPGAMSSRQDFSNPPAMAVSPTRAAPGDSEIAFWDWATDGSYWTFTVQERSAELVLLEAGTSPVVCAPQVERAMAVLPRAEVWMRRAKGSVRWQWSRMLRRRTRAIHAIRHATGNTALADAAASAVAKAEAGLGEGVMQVINGKGAVKLRPGQDRRRPSLRARDDIVTAAQLESIADGVKEQIEDEDEREKEAEAREIAGDEDGDTERVAPDDGDPGWAWLDEADLRQELQRRVALMRTARRGATASLLNVAARETAAATRALQEAVAAGLAADEARTAAAASALVSASADGGAVDGCRITVRQLHCAATMLGMGLSTRKRAVEAAAATELAFRQVQAAKAASEAGGEGAAVAAEAAVAAKVAAKAAAEEAERVKAQDPRTWLDEARPWAAMVRERRSQLQLLAHAATCGNDQDWNTKNVKAQLLETHEMMRAADAEAVVRHWLVDVDVRDLKESDGTIHGGGFGGDVTDMFKHKEGEQEMGADGEVDPDLTRQPPPSCFSVLGIVRGRARALRRVRCLLYPEHRPHSLRVWCSPRSLMLAALRLLEATHYIPIRDRWPDAELENSENTHAVAITLWGNPTETGETADPEEAEAEEGMKVNGWAPLGFLAWCTQRHLYAARFRYHVCVCRQLRRALSGQGVPPQVVRSAFAMVRKMEVEWLQSDDRDLDGAQDEDEPEPEPVDGVIVLVTKEKAEENVENAAAQAFAQFLHMGAEIIKELRRRLAVVETVEESVDMGTHSTVKSIEAAAAALALNPWLQTSGDHDIALLASQHSPSKARRRMQDEDDIDNEIHNLDAEFGIGGMMTFGAAAGPGAELLGNLPAAMVDSALGGIMSRLDHGERGREEHSVQVVVGLPTKCPPLPSPVYPCPTGVLLSRVAVFNAVPSRALSNVPAVPAVPAVPVVPVVPAVPAVPAVPVVLLFLLSLLFLFFLLFLLYT
jgi:hypothetical protein